MLHLFCIIIARVLNEYYKRMFQGCYLTVKKFLHGCFKSVPTVLEGLQRCYKGVSTLLNGCFNYVTLSRIQYHTAVSFHVLQSTDPVFVIYLKGRLLLLSTQNSIF